MAKKKIKIVVWDSIGNTVLGVRPWSSWDEKQVEHFLREDPAGPERAKRGWNVTTSGHHCTARRQRDSSRCSA
jgi:hypothetical protein